MIERQPAAAVLGDSVKVGCFHPGSIPRPAARQRAKPSCGAGRRSTDVAGAVARPLSRASSDSSSDSVRCASSIVRGLLRGR